MKKSTIILMSLLFTILFITNCKTKHQKYYLRMQLVEFTNDVRIKVFEDTIAFESNDEISAFKLGDKIVKQKMDQMKINGNNKFELNYFEILNSNFSNISKNISDEDKKNSYNMSSNYRKKIDSLHLIID
jgi:hypothetical protein